MAATRSSRTSTAYIKVEVATDTYANRSFKGINPDVTDAVLVDTLVTLGGLQSHTVESYSRQNQCHMV